MINNTLFGVHTEDIHRVYLADNEWYEINASIQVENNKYFSAWCIRDRDWETMYY